MSYYPDFAERLDHYLAAQDRAGAWLAQRLGVNPATVSRWRSGTSRPGQPELIMRIADLLRIPDAERSRLLHAAGYGVIQASRQVDFPAVATGDTAPNVTAATTPPRLRRAYPPTYRQAEVATLAQWLELGASGIVLGLAGSGVSTLLRHLVQQPMILTQQLVRATPVVPIWIELLPATTVTSAILYRTLLRSILEHAGQEPSFLPAHLVQNADNDLQVTDPFVLQTTLFALLAHCAATQVGVLLVFDRIDQLDEPSQRTIGNTLRALRDRFQETIALLMGWRLTPDYDQQLHTLGDLGRLLSPHTCVVGALSEQDSLFVIDQLTRVVGVQPDEADIEQFLLLSGGYPTLLKAVVRWWLTEQPPIPHKQWHGMLRHESGVQFRLREIWACLSPEEQNALRTLIATSGTPATISVAIGTRLTALGLCHQSPRGWQLAATLFAGLG